MARGDQMSSERVPPGTSDTNPQLSSQPTTTITQPETTITSPPPQPDPQIQPQPQPNPPENIHKMRTRSKNQIVKPKTKFSLTIQTKPFIPTTLNQALRDEKWRNSMSDEFNAVQRNHTYDLVPPKPHHNVIPTTWIHTIKYLPSGTIDMHKSRLVARGDTQQYGLDYAETFSPVIKSTTVRLVPEQAVRLDWLPYSWMLIMPSSKVPCMMKYMCHSHRGL